MPSVSLSLTTKCVVNLIAINSLKEHRKVESFPIHRKIETIGEPREWISDVHHVIGINDSVTILVLIAGVSRVFCDVGSTELMLLDFLIGLIYSFIFPSPEAEERKSLIAHGVASLDSLATIQMGETVLNEREVAIYVVAKISNGIGVTKSKFYTFVAYSADIHSA